MRKRKAKRDPAAAIRQAEFAADLRARLEAVDASYRRRNKDVAAAAHAGPLPIQQAKNPARGPQFLQIVAKPSQANREAKPEPKLTRVAFKVSRLMEFCTERELENQTGHSIWEWPLVVAKELIDNALDACEEAEVQGRSAAPRERKRPSRPGTWR